MNSVYKVMFKKTPSDRGSLSESDDLLVLAASGEAAITKAKKHILRLEEKWTYNGVDRTTTYRRFELVGLERITNIDLS